MIDLEATAFRFPISASQATEKNLHGGKVNRGKEVHGPGHKASGMRHGTVAGAGAASTSQHH